MKGVSKAETHRPGDTHTSVHTRVKPGFALWCPFVLVLLRQLRSRLCVRSHCRGRGCVRATALLLVWHDHACAHASPQRVCTAASLHTADVISEKRGVPPLGTTHSALSPNHRSRIEAGYKVGDASGRAVPTRVLRGVLTAHTSGCINAAHLFSRGRFY